MGFTYLTRSNPYKLQRLHWEKRKSPLLLPISTGDSQSFRMEKERLANIIFSYILF